MDEEGKVGCGKDTQRLAHEILAKEIENNTNTSITSTVQRKTKEKS